MIETLVLYIFLAVFSARFLMVAAVVVGSGWYDALYAPKTNIATDKTEPHVTVFIEKHSRTDDIEACLKSVSASTYKNHGVVVANDNSPDDVYAHTNFYITIDANSQLAPGALEAAVNHFKKNDNTEEVYLNTRPLPSLSLLGLWQRFAYLSDWQLMKLRALFSHGNRSIYLNNAVVFIPASTAIEDFLSHKNYAFIAAVLDVSMLGYFAYVAYEQNSPLLLSMGALLLVFWLGFSVWSAVEMGFLQKLRLSLQIPAACLLFIVKTTLQLTAPMNIKILNKPNHRLL